jgi:hypothetical protein
MCSAVSVARWYVFGFAITSMLADFDIGQKFLVLPFGLRESSDAIESSAQVKFENNSLAIWLVTFL